MNDKKKIALVVDADNWAFANIAKNVSKNLSDIYDFKIIPIVNLDNNLAKVYILAEDCDLIHFFWRGNIIGEFEDNFKWYIEYLGFTLPEFKERYMNKPITTAVYDHLFLDEEIEITKRIFSICDKYYTSSNILKRIYNKLDLKYYPQCVITDGVDLNDFYPKRLERFSNIKNRKIKIGWVGNSEWASDKEDFKGANTILKPVLKELIEEGYAIEEYFADRQVRMIPHDQMVNYYSDIDILICTSKCEGTPNPVLEAMACGIPVISTRVGIVPDALGKKQKEFILEERTRDCLKQKIIYLLERPELFKELSQENLLRIKNWTWKEISKKFNNFFDMYLNKNAKDKLGD